MAEADFILTKVHGFYELAPQTPAAAQFVAALDPKLVAIGDGGVLLDSFFANAGDWVRICIMPSGLSVQWGDATYQGERGAADLWEECA